MITEIFSTFVPLYLDSNIQYCSVPDRATYPTCRSIGLLYNCILVDRNVPCICILVDRTFLFIFTLADRTFLFICTLADSIIHDHSLCPLKFWSNFFNISTIIFAFPTGILIKHLYEINEMELYRSIVWDFFQSSIAFPS